jgi:prepilin-type N-terminal cleavage/methylation domain-containing protein
MQRKGFTWIEAVVVVAILGILGAILYPAIRPRPARFYTARIAPQHFDKTELHIVLARLDDALKASRAQQGKKSPTRLKNAQWESEALKHRLVSLDTPEQPLKEVLDQLEKATQIRLDYGGWCGTCGSPIGGLTIKDAHTTPHK